MIKSKGWIFLIILLVVSIDKSHALSILHLQSVTNGTEHHVNDSPDYNEDNDGKLYEITTKPIRDNNFRNISTHYRYTNGHFINSHYQSTRFTSFAGEACLGDILNYCWSFGVGGFAGYSDTPDMLEGFAFVPIADHSLQINAKSFKAVYRQYWLISSVSSEYWGLGYQFEF